MEEFSQFVANINIFLALLLDKVDSNLFGHLSNRTLNFSNVHPLDMLQHLIATSVRVTANELKENFSSPSHLESLPAHCWPLGLPN